MARDEQADAIDSQADQDAFGEWLAREAAVAASEGPGVEAAASQFASGVFGAVVMALEEGNVHNDLDGELELLRLQFGEQAQELGIDEPEAVAFMARIENLAETGVGASHGADHYQLEISRALQALQGAISKSGPTPGEVHVPGASRRPRRSRKRSFTEFAKGSGLYVERPLVNTAELREWAQKMGLPELDPFPHVTVVHSKTAVPWTEAKDTVVIWPKQLGLVAPLGKDGAIVVFFSSDRLHDRWQEALARGATWDYDGFNPHLTLFYKKGWGGVVPVPTFPLVLGPERAGPVDEDLHATLKVEKTDPDQRLVTGWVSIIEDERGNPIEDTQGDIIDEQDLVEAAHKFMKESREAGDSHARIKGIGTVVESVVFTKGLKEKLGLAPSFPTGWLITVKVDDESTWQRVKKGELSAFSIGGTGIREPL